MNIDSIFTKNVIEKLNQIHNPSEELVFRLKVLECKNNQSSNYSKIRQMWDSYISTASKCQLFDSKNGEDLKKRFTSIKDTDFLSAHSELLACWFFNEKLSFNIKPWPIGRLKSVLDFSLIKNGLEIYIEVKAPYYYERGSSSGFSNLHNKGPEIIKNVIKKAHKKFSKGNINCIVLVPAIGIDTPNGKMGSPFSYREMCISAIYEKFERWEIPIPINGKSKAQFNKVQQIYSTGKFIRTDQGLHRFTRISIVVLLYYNNNWDVCCEIYHNPFAINPAPEDVWGNYPQFVPRMMWINDK